MYRTWSLGLTTKNLPQFHSFANSHFSLLNYKILYKMQPCVFLTLIKSHTRYTKPFAIEHLILYLVQFKCFCYSFCSRNTSWKFLNLLFLLHDNLQRYTWLWVCNVINRYLITALDKVTRQFILLQSDGFYRGGSHVLFWNR